MRVMNIPSNDYTGTRRSLSAWGTPRIPGVADHEQPKMSVSIDNSRGSIMGVVRLNRDQAIEFRDYINAWLEEQGDA